MQFHTNTDWSLECDSLTRSLCDFSLPQGKQEVPETRFLLECESASLAKAHAGKVLAQKVTGWSRKPLKCIKLNLFQLSLFVSSNKNHLMALGKFTKKVILT